MVPNVHQPDPQGPLLLMFRQTRGPTGGGSKVGEHSQSAPGLAVITNILHKQSTSLTVFL